MHIHVADDIMYHRANRGDDTTFADVSLHHKCRGARRHSWWMCVVCCGLQITLKRLQTTGECLQTTRECLQTVSVVCKHSQALVTGCACVCIPAEFP